MSTQSLQNGNFSESTEAENRLIELAKYNSESISNDDITKHMPDVPLTEITTIINKCLKNGTFDLFKTKDNLL
ncbi:unnamed protein product [Diabrotica balteata]|uniref:Uncharacterized protein n=1 Tax=Diabrotica balteata TaxID=107213 RepID=A0A9N9TAX8_DIABA|nr:unnamed protein product [Diabrotica balteata]